MSLEKKIIRGRPLKSEEDNTAEKILQAARSLFVEKGFSATSISDIAKKASINQSLIYHHFGNKQDLWKKVKEHVLKDSGQFHSFVLKTETTLQEFLGHIINQRTSLYENNPDLARMMLWQRLEDSDQSLKGGTSASPDEWKEMIVRLQEEGRIRSDLDPDMIIALIIHAVTGIYLYPSPLFNSMDKRKLYTKMVLDFLEQSLSAPDRKILVY
ncbi:MAG: TetR/AcrR family transcriptional regulator [Alphaproteobacteria bacterium]|nr:TetR/AcrR family transcriptional regulator [Alphaproteobacteria bacterium]